MFSTFLVLATLGTNSVFGIRYTTIYMKDNCGGTASLGSAGYIEWDRGDRYDHRADCSVILTTGSVNYKIWLQFIDIDIEENGRYSCYDYLYLYEGSVSNFGYRTPTPNKAICNSQLVRDYSSSRTSLTLRLVTDGSTAGSFRILYTSFADSVGRSCSFGRYLCSNGRCIAGELSCDRMDNCGDTSDESVACHHETYDSLSYCADGRYLDNKYMCDGTVDCQDKSDERTYAWAMCPAAEMQLSCDTLVTLDPATSGYIVYSRYGGYTPGTDCTVQYNTQSGYVIRLDQWDVSGMDYHCYDSLHLCDGITGGCDDWEEDFSICHWSPDERTYVTSGPGLTVRVAADQSGNFKIFYRIEQGGGTSSSTVVTVVVVVIVVILLICVVVYCCGKRSRSDHDTGEVELARSPTASSRDNIHMHPTTVIHTDQPGSRTPTIERTPQPSPRQYSYPSAPPNPRNSPVAPSLMVQPPTPSESLAGEPPPPAYDQALLMPKEPPPRLS